MKLVLIAALSENHVIAKEGDLPWRLPQDLARFKKVTQGHPVIMGRTTMDTLPAPLSGRRCIILTRDTHWSREGVEVAHSIDEAIDLASQDLPQDEVVFIAGGGKVYADTIDRADELDLTRVHSHIEGDTFFPSIQEARWVRESVDFHPEDERHSHAFTFERWVRRDANPR